MNGDGKTTGYIQAEYEAITNDGIYVGNGKPRLGTGAEGVSEARDNIDAFWKKSNNIEANSANRESIRTVFS